jgi:hypothetical protein
LKKVQEKFGGKTLRDQKMSLAETYSSQVYQITGMMGLSWMMYIGGTGKNISFINEVIQY